jgi:hypothetical protein
MNYIDIKVTVWNRLHFDEKANMEGIARIIEEGGLQEVIDPDLGYLEEETLDMEERIDPIDNNEFSTIEVYSEETLIWENGKTNQ